MQQSIPSTTAAAVSTRLQILADCGHEQRFQDPTCTCERGAEPATEAQPFPCKSTCPEPGAALVNTKGSRSEC